MSTGEPKGRAKRLVERAGVVRRVRGFFEARDFLEVETPILVPSPGMDLHLDAYEVKDTSGAPAARYLITSPEYQMKRLLAEGHGRIVQFSKCFRKNEFGSRHNPEFTMVEWYRAHADASHVMADTEDLVREVTSGRVTLSSEGSNCRVIDTSATFERITVLEAFARFAGTSEDETLAMAKGDEDRFYRLMVERVEPALATFDVPVFMTEYPAEQASLARRKPSDVRVAERFELYVAGVELCNGFTELTDVHEQRARFEADQAARRAHGKDVLPIDERFLEDLARMPPAGGNALGLDRLIALACGTTNIKEVIAFTADEV